MLQKVMKALKTLNELFLELHIEEPDKYVYEYVYNLFFLVATLKPKTILELGTGPKGIATRSMLAGLLFNGEGHLTTVEIVDDERMHMAHQHLRQKIREMNARYMVTFVTHDDLTLKITKHVDMVFIDSSHNYADTLRELTKYSVWTNLIVCHDTKIKSDVPQAVQKAIDTFLGTHREWRNKEISGTPLGLGILYKGVKG